MLPQDIRYSIGDGINAVGRAHMRRRHMDGSWTGLTDNTDIMVVTDLTDLMDRLWQIRMNIIHRFRVFSIRPAGYANAICSATSPCLIIIGLPFLLITTATTLCSTCSATCYSACSGISFSFGSAAAHNAEPTVFSSSADSTSKYTAAYHNLLA